MVDFLSIGTRITKSAYEIYPNFRIKKSKDLMIRGGDFYAIWIDERGLWSIDEFDALSVIDRELDLYFESNKTSLPPNTRVLHLWDSETGMIDRWHKYCQSQMRDNYVTLDETIIFSDKETTRTDYASKKLPYPMIDCDTPNYDKLVKTLYDPEELHKIEWAIGSIVSGDSRWIQKFLVLYGAAGTGKSTILQIIQSLFEGYETIFDAKSLTSSTNVFALESFRSNPLVAIQHDGDLSRIEDNTKLNSLVSHEEMTVNEKYKSTYTNRFKAFLFMGTNKPVRITDSKSGILRRLIDVYPSGRLVPINEYRRIMDGIKFELGGIATHCLSVYLENPAFYDNYVPLRMMDATNDTYNFVLDNYTAFKKEDGVSLKDAWELYKNYCEEANVAYPLTKRVFKEELRSYFREFFERSPEKKYNYYSGFLTERFEKKRDIDEQKSVGNGWIVLSESSKDHVSRFEMACSECQAQYANKEGTPIKPWDKVQTVLKEVDTSRLHYVRCPENHIVIDFDLKNADGNKDLSLNISAALAYPPTYCEVSKSGSGLHLHYIYNGDVSSLCPVVAPGIEIKVCTGKQAIRRCLTLCNDLDISEISSGLPVKGDGGVVSPFTVKSENAVRALIIKNLNKEIHAYTKPSIDFIKKILDDAYASGLRYDLRDMENDILNFASRSSNNPEYCIKKVLEMKLCSDDVDGDISFSDDSPLCFFDIEVFPNLFILCWKLEGEDQPVIKMINPEPADVRIFLSYGFKLIGFNNVRYDNHLVYARAYRNYTNEDLYKLSNRIIKEKSNNHYITEAKNLSYTDVYDFASASNKKSLKKLEIEMGIHHQEFPEPWDKPLDKDKWENAAEYCSNDVRATEAAFHYLKSDWVARQVLADIAGMTPNTSTNNLSAAIIFGGNRNPQSQFNYRDLSKPVRPGDPILTNMGVRTFRIFDAEGQPTYQTWHGEDLPEGYSVLPFFPGYTFEMGKSTYKGYEVGEGGFVYANVGMYRYIDLLDIASMHPSSMLAECLFGPKYTKILEDIVNLRIDIKHGDFEAAKTLFDGKLVKYLDDPEALNGLADAMKTVINSIYGLTSAKFMNLFRDQRNVDNIVAKRGALFMIHLMDALRKNFPEKFDTGIMTIVHIKTDSIKISNANDEIRNFIFAYGKEFGYNFEYEARYECMTLVNNAVYIARYDEFGIRNKGGKKAGKWTATGTQFAVPFVFKTLFSKEELTFDDFTQVFSVTSALYLDINEKLPDVSREESEYKKLIKSNDPTAGPRIQQLEDRIARGHFYKFIGRIGEFIPVKPNQGGGLLCRKTENKPEAIAYAAAANSLGKRWIEAELLRKETDFSKIDMTYFYDLAEEAEKDIGQYGDFEWFANHPLDDPTDKIYPF